MESIARYFARELGFDLQAALDRPAAAYQADVCGKAEHGIELRRLTAKACFLQAPYFADLASGANADDLFVDEGIWPTVPEHQHLEAAA